MKEIALTQGQVALVDDEDYDKMSGRMWQIHTLGYARTTIEGRSCYMHRLVTNAARDEEIDHINGNKLDNRKANLRKATRFQNMQNVGPRYGGNKSSRFKGVYWDGSTNRWKALLTVARTKHRLGGFRDEIEAARAYDAAAKQHHGDFAWLNFPNETI